MNTQVTNRKTLLKAAILSTSLVMGLTLGQSMFNEAQATGGSGSKGPLKKSNLGKYCCGNTETTSCGAAGC